MFINLEGANTYFAGRLHVGPWDAADATTRQKALTMADAMIRRLEFRPGVIAADGTGPVEIGHAVAELALALIRDDLTSDTARRAAGAVRKRVGDIDIEYPAGGVGIIPEFVLSILRPFLAAGSSTSARLVP